MSLFQNSVLKKHLASQDHNAIEEAYGRYSSYFHDKQIQNNIRNSKEEQFQEGFLRELFVKIFGYTINPEPNFNLTTELKNIKDAKKTDGAILDPNNNALAVIELKGTDTKNLDKVNEQAFNYKNNQPACVYVITSNFEKLRFYVHNAVEHEEFNLFTLSIVRFRLLWLLLQKDNLLGEVPVRLKEESLLIEDKITKSLYRDYSSFKSELWNDLVKKNPQYDPLLLYKKSQKLLDRFLFIFFSEDKGLLPPNSISRVIDRWEVLRDEDAYKSVYDIFKQYFGYMDIGRKGKVPADDISAYNGGLFQADEVLDTVFIDDELLKSHCLKLTRYDFDDEVDTNILGHIFEHSLNDIENVRAQLAGQEIEKSKTKRKKDGVFYTPKYITKYIVDNTVGILCEDKKRELGIDEEEFAKSRKGRRKDTLRELDSQLKLYREWLLRLTICDPACGSGAFLNQALEFLMSEHAYVNELESQLLGYTIVFPDVENHILEQNIYGVDINEESVEIARLSLWLRTAKKGRKLNALSNNLKTGNSLINDSEVAGELAFDWEEQFPKVFEKGGFDVVIGNPPYLRVQGLRESFASESIFYENNYESATGRFDIYVLFIERSYRLINNHGKVSFILPHKFLGSDFGSGIRGFLSKNQAVESLIHFGSEMVFEDASTYTCILGLNKASSIIRFKELKPADLFNQIKFDEINAQDLSDEKWSFNSTKVEKVLSKLAQQELAVKDVFEWISQGVVSVGDSIFLLKGDIKGNSFFGFSEKINAPLELEAEIVKPLLKGEDVKKYAPLNPSYYVLYPHFEKDGKTFAYAEDVFKEKFPHAYNYMIPFKEELIEKKIRYKTNPKHWYSLHRSREKSLFETEKIITPEISLGTNMTYDSGHLFHNTKCYSLVKKNEVSLDLKYLLAILNSKVMWCYLSSTGYVLRGGFFTFKTKYLEPFPLPTANSDSQKALVDAVDNILQITAKFALVSSSMLSLIQSKFLIDKPTKKLHNWAELDFSAFLAELNKKKVKLNLEEEEEWLRFFDKKKAEANALSAEIEQIDREINQKVYELYDLNDEEIEIIENSAAKL